MTKAAHKPFAIELRARSMIDPVTGCRVGAFVAASAADSSMLNERGFKPGARIRAVLSQPRNSKFNGLVHGLGVLLGQNLERFAGLKSHEVIKALQIEAGAYCTRAEYDVPGFGRIIRIEPQSLSYDSMSEEQFADFWRQCCAHVLAKDWPDMTAEQLEQLAAVSAEGGKA